MFPPSVQELPPKDHLARFVVDVVEQLDLSGLEESYPGRGGDAHHPAMLVALLLYGYATGTFSSRATAVEDRVKFQWLDGYLGGRLLHTITRDDVQAIGAAKARESSRATADRYLALVRAVLKRAAGTTSFGSREHASNVDRTPR